MMTHRHFRFCGLAALCLVVLGACTFGGDTQSNEGAAGSAPSFTPTECPPEVASGAFGDVTCGFVTVPENRFDPTRTVDVFVTRIVPPGGATGGREPILVVGSDQANTPNYVGISPLAQRTGREVVIVDSRGTAHSVPSLDCPEVHAASARQLEAAQERDAERNEYLDAVRACREHLTGDGIDVAAYNLSEMAADLEDVRLSLGIDAWHAAAYGTASRTAVELVRQSPGAVRSLTLDSPELPGMDPQRVALEHTPRLVRQVLEACMNDPRCARRFPEATTLYDEALAAVSREPLDIRGPTPDGGPGKVILDSATLVRVVRQIASDGGSSGLVMTLGSIPRVLQDVVERDTQALNRRLAPILLQQEAFCLGYSAHCLSRHHLSVGPWLTISCRDVLPFTDRSPAGSRRDVHDVLIARVNQDVCRAWDVGEAPPEAGAPAQFEVPTLILLGKHASYTPDPLVREAAAGMTSVSIVVDPAGGHNVLPRTECMLQLRQEWLEEPSQPASQPQCLRRESISWDLE
jgi:pimeloyl-ACP methyl ester carboxylesterase